jgi:hypothetical protein
MFVAGVTVAILAGGRVAFAAWSSTGQGSGRTSATSLAQGYTPTVGVSGSSVTVTWNQNSLNGGYIGALGGGGYQMTRYNGSGMAFTPGANCSGTLTGAGASLSCTETSVPDGQWQYTVTPVLGTWRGAESNKSVAATVDTTAPGLVTLQMFDTNANGKVDQVKATFSETLAAYSAGTAPWTLASVPSGGTLSSVSVAGAVATLTITEGAGAADTSVGSFTVALATNASGVRDASANLSSFAATAVADKAAPVATDVQTTNVGGGTLGHPELGDTITLTYSETIGPSSILAGWTGTSQSVVVRIGDLNPDVLTVWNAANSAQLPLGSVSLGRNDYVAANRTFGASGTASTMVQSGSAITITLGTASGATGTAAATGTMAWTPSATATDPAGNTCSVTARNETGAADKDL